MRKLLLPIAFVMILSACKNEEETKIAGTSESADVSLPLDVAYKGKAAIGKMENVVTVMNWNKHLIAGHIDSAFQSVGDSLSCTFADGMRFTLGRDSAMAMVTAWMSQLDSAHQTYNAVIPVDNTTAGDEWVIQWTNEHYYFKGGKVEKQNLCESYKLKNGKIRSISQFAQVPEMPADKK